MPDLLGLHDLVETPQREVLALLLGLVVGSFANVVIHRLPLGQSIVSPRSRCPRCGTPIRSLDNVPVLSWLVLRGRCRACREPISARYPVVELANGSLYLAASWRWGATAQTVVAMVLSTVLLVLALIDLDHQILPDAITRPGIALGLLASVLPGPPTPLAALLSALGGYLAFAAVATAYRLTRGQEGLGGGDWKLAALLGAFLGWEKMLLTVLLASVAGTVVGLALMAARGHDARYRLPLGTFLAATAVLVLFVGDALVSWYAGLLGS